MDDVVNINRMVCLVCKKYDEENNKLKLEIKGHLGELQKLNKLWGEKDKENTTLKEQIISERANMHSLAREFDCVKEIEPVQIRDSEYKVVGIDYDKLRSKLQQLDEAVKVIEEIAESDCEESDCKICRQFQDNDCALEVNSFIARKFLKSLKQKEVKE
jgi:hypothetical protein